jgi:hypothetical protein
MCKRKRALAFKRHSSSAFKEFGIEVTMQSTGSWFARPMTLNDCLHIHSSFYVLHLGIKKLPDFL